MKFKKLTESFKLKPESFKDLLYAFKILKKGDIISFKDFRRFSDANGFYSTDLKRNEKVIVKIEMQILNLNLLEKSLNIKGAITGSSFHNYDLKINEEIEIKKKLTPLEISFLSLNMQNQDFTIVLILGNFRYTIIRLKDYVYEILKSDDFYVSKSLNEEFLKINKILNFFEPKKFILATNLIYMKIFKKVNTNFIFYETELEEFNFIHNLDFYKSNKIKNLTNFKNQIKEILIYEELIKVKNKLVFENVKNFIENNPFKKLYITLEAYDPSYNNIPLEKVIILSSNFTKLKKLPPVFILKYY